MLNLGALKFTLIEFAQKIKSAGKDRNEVVELVETPISFAYFSFKRKVMKKKE
ncbi:MAG: hypothetical protein JSU07_10920 [Bacteroidetes bacterium]|nr:hypothetical protein [Bacteroidota bacterium]